MSKQRIEELQAQYSANKPWYVHEATRQSAEDILFQQGSVSVATARVGCTRSLAIFFSRDRPDRRRRCERERQC